MSVSTRHVLGLMRNVSRAQHHRMQPTSLFSSRQIIAYGKYDNQLRKFSITQYINSANSTLNNNNNDKGELEKPPTTINAPKLILQSTAQPPGTHEHEHPKPIEQVIADLNTDFIIPPSTANTESDSQIPPEAGSTSGTNTDEGGQSKKKQSRFWFYLYQVILWSSIGSIPIHLLLLRGETKELKEKQELKIFVLTEMRDKLRRGESIEEEEALLSIGLDRSKREEHVDERYFEDLLKSAEKLDFVFGKDSSDVASIPTKNPQPVPAVTPAPPPPTPRKPAPPKSEKSYF
ncbi:hypothetical protein BGZ76_008037 [Entomortierella beljakovae]|nr:hypothetical protein BGZ76_008037 [Entomortierella beljakovae]